MVHRLRFRLSLIVSSVLVPALSFAAACPAGSPRCIAVSIGTKNTIPEAAARAITFLAATITTVASVMFLIGAFMIVLSGAKEDYKQKGKDLMIGSLMGIAVVLGAYAIWRTVLYIIV